jgi:hypothetical protein
MANHNGPNDAAASAGQKEERGATTIPFLGRQGPFRRR